MTPLRAACGMTIRAMNTMVKDLLICRVDNEFVFQNVHPDTAATLHEGRVVAVREKLIFISCGHLEHVLLTWCQRVLPEVIRAAPKLENSANRCQD